MKRPIIPIVLSLILGILIQDQYNSIYPYLFLFATVIILNKSKDYRHLILIFLMVGAVLSKYHNNKYNPLEQSTQITATIHEKTIEDYGMSYIIKPHGKNFKYKLRVYSESDFEVGDKISFQSEVKIPNRNTNPGLFNERQYLKSKNIYGIIDIKNAHQITLIGENNILKLKSVFHNYIIDTFDQSLSETDSNLLKTIFLGKNTLSDEVNEQYQTLGISHLLAISGFHVSLIALLISILFKKLIPYQSIEMALLLLTLWIYGYLIGFPPSVFRAIFMITIVALSSKFLLAWDRKNILFLSLFILIVINPFSIYNIGLQLSYLATYIIIETMDNYNGTKESLKDKIKLTATIYFGLLPLQLYYFNDFSFGFLIGNLFVVPLFSMVIVLGLLFLLFSKIPFISLTFRLLLEWTLSFLSLVIRGSEIFVAKWKIENFNIIWVLFFYMLFYLYMNYNRELKKYLYILLTTAFAIIMTTKTQNLIYNPVTITMIDIGQGDSFIISSKNSSILLDTGGSFWENDRSGEYTLIPVLQQRVNHLDYVFLSHFDEDHAGNLEDVLKEFEPKAIVGSEGRKKILEEKYNIFYPYIGLGEDQIEMGEIIFESFYNEKASTENDNSLVLKLTAHNKSVLFTGDIEQETERYLLDKSIQSDILKIPHHGSNTSSSDSFLKEVSPSLALLSVGRNNIYNLPKEEVLERYANYGIPVLGTDEFGLVDITIHRFGVEVEPYLQMKRDYSKEIVSILLWTGILYLYINHERKKIELFRWY